MKCGGESGGEGYGGGGRLAVHAELQSWDSGPN